MFPLRPRGLPLASSQLQRNAVWRARGARSVPEVSRDRGAIGEAIAAGRAGRRVRAVSRLRDGLKPATAFRSDAFLRHP